jgi:hypothetical protein
MSLAGSTTIIVYAIIWEISKPLSRAYFNMQTKNAFYDSFISFFEGNGFIEVRRIDAAKDVAAMLSKGRNVVYLPSGGKGGTGNGAPSLLLNVGKDHQPTQ